MTFKEAVMQLHDRANELAEAAGMLVNQNLADVLKAAAGKLKQASEHADCEAVDEAVKARVAEHEAAKVPEQPPAFDPSNTQAQ